MCQKEENLKGLEAMTNYSERLSPIIEEAIDTHPPLSAEAERRLFETMPREFAEQTVILHSLGYAVETARHWQVPNAAFGDIFQYVVLAMVKAIKSYDVSKCDPDMRFTGFVRTCIDSKMLNLCSPKSGLADTKMNLMTSPLSKELVEEHDDGSLIDALVSQGREIAGLRDPEPKDINPEYAFKSIVACLSKNHESAVFSTPKARERFNNDLRFFLKNASGCPLDVIAAEEGKPRDTVRSSVSRIRMLFVRLALSNNCPTEWKWLFNKSDTIKVARSHFEEIKSITNEHAWKKISSARNDYVTRVLRHSTMNYNKLLGCVYQRRYRLRNVYRPERGGTHTAEGYRACLRIEHEQQLGARMSNHEPPTERNKTWQHREHR